MGDATIVQPDPAAAPMEPTAGRGRPDIVSHPRRIGLLVAIAVLAAACSTGSSGLDGRSFLSTAVTDDGAPLDLVPETRIRLAFTDGQITASAGCNTIGGTYRLDGGTLVFEGGGMTEMGCDPDRHAQDEWISELLGSRPGVSLTGDELVLTAGSTVVHLLDREVADPDLALAGTLWTVDSIISGDAESSVPEGAVATLRFAADGTVSVTGCNTGGGRYEVSGDRLRLIDIAVTEIGCTGAAGALEVAVLPVIGVGELRYQIEAGRLTLRAGNGSGLGLQGS